MPKVSNILFDIGNVLLDLDIEGTRDRLSKFRKKGMTRDAFFTQIIPLAEAYEKGEITTPLFLERAAEYMTPEITPEMMTDAWNDMLLTVPAYRLGMLTALRENFTLIAVSNTNALHLARFHAHLESVHGVSDFETRYFDEVYYSHLLGTRKPEPPIFNHVIEDAMITPERTLFIDDDPGHLEAAGKLGFQVMHSPPGHEVAEALKLLGYY